MASLPYSVKSWNETPNRLEPLISLGLGEKTLGKEQPYLQVLEIIFLDIL